MLNKVSNCTYMYMIQNSDNLFYYSAFVYHKEQVMGGHVHGRCT